MHDHILWYDSDCGPSQAQWWWDAMDEGVLWTHSQANGDNYRKTELPTRKEKAVNTSCSKVWLNNPRMMGLNAKNSAAPQSAIYFQKHFYLKLAHSQDIGEHNPSLWI